MAQRGGDTRKKAAENGKRVGRPGGQKPPPRPSKGDLRDLYDALNRPAKDSDSYQVKRWRTRTESEDLLVAHKADTYLIDQIYGKAAQPVDHGVTGVVEINLHANFKMPDPHER